MSQNKAQMNRNTVNIYILYCTGSQEDPILLFCVESLRIIYTSLHTHTGSEPLGAQFIKKEEIKGEMIMVCS